MQTLLIAAALALCGAAPSGEIAYVSGIEQEDRCVRVLDVETGGSRRVGLGKRDGAPAWSPDGEWLAFSTQHEGLRIAVVRADGSEPPQILEHEMPWNKSPVWDPALGRRRVAYVSGEGGIEEQHIRVYDLNDRKEIVWGGGRPGLMRPMWLGDSKLVAVLREELQRIGGYEARVWSAMAPEPDDTLLAIGATPSSEGLTTDIYVVTRELALPLPPSIMPSEGRYEEWAVAPSPDGKQVVFESNDGGDREIFVLTSKGAFDISNHRAADWNPVWSPKGEWIAFESFRAGRRGVFRVNSKSSWVSPAAVAEKADCWGPAWSPDGRWLAYVSNATGKPAIYVCDAQGEQAQRLTRDDGGEALAPAWHPISEAE